MTYVVELTAATARQFRKLDRPVRRRPIAAIEGPADDPQPAGAIKLGGGRSRRPGASGGDDGVIYDVLDEALVVTVVRAGHRREVHDQ